MTFTIKDIKQLDLMTTFAGKDEWVVCEKCGIKDVSKPPVFDNGKLKAAGHVGTKKEMRCNDCCAVEERNDEHPYRAGFARLCRKCCPSEHMTTFAKESADMSFDEVLLKLCSGLRNKGFNSHAESIEQKFLIYKSAANTHLYQAHDEDGEDLINAAHPDGDVNMGDGERGDVETILSQHKKIVDVINKTPTGKLATYVNQCKVAIGATPLVPAEDEPYNTAKDALAKFYSVYKSILVSMGEDANGNDPYFESLNRIIDKKEIYKFRDFPNSLTDTMKGLKNDLEPSYLSLTHSSLSPEQEQKWQTVQKFFPILNKYADRFNIVVSQIQKAEIKAQTEKEVEEVKQADPEKNASAEKVNNLIIRLNNYLPMVSKYNTATTYINSTVEELKGLLNRFNKEGITPELNSLITEKEKEISEFATA